MESTNKLTSPHERVSPLSGRADRKSEADYNKPIPNDFIRLVNPAHTMAPYRVPRRRGPDPTSPAGHVTYGRPPITERDIRPAANHRARSAARWNARTHTVPHDRPPRRQGSVALHDRWKLHNYRPKCNTYGCLVLTYQFFLF